MFKSQSGPKGRYYTDEDWNTDSKPETNTGDAYMYSKV